MLKRGTYAAGRLWALVAVFLVVGISLAQREDPQNDPQAKKLIQLDEDNWQLMLKGEWMVEFFAPWCPACKNLAPTWEQFAKIAADSDVHVAKIDVTTSPSLSGRFFVTALPTIYHVKDSEFRQYRGSRDGDALMFFIKQKQWQKIEPISAWKKPDTIHMSILSYFFKLSHLLKDFNARLQDEYGLPSWGSYALFAVGTIFVGAALGLLLVCIVDFLYPPKKTQRQSFNWNRDRSENADIEDIARDELEDDITDNEADNDNDDDDDDDDEPDEDTATAKGRMEDGGVDDGDEAEIEEAEDAEDESDTSDGEKNSHSESESPESEKNATVIVNANDGVGKDFQTKAKSTHSPSEVRKRKPRKAD